MADDPKPSADVITDDAPRRRRRDLEDRISDLEDRNETLHKTNKLLEKKLEEICKSLTVTPPKNPESGAKSFWEELSSALGF